MCTIRFSKLGSHAYNFKTYESNHNIIGTTGLQNMQRSKVSNILWFRKGFHSSVWVDRLCSSFVQFDTFSLWIRWTRSSEWGRSSLQDRPIHSDLEMKAKLATIISRTDLHRTSTEILPRLVHKKYIAREISRGADHSKSITSIKWMNRCASTAIRLTISPTVKSLRAAFEIFIAWKRYN